MSTPPDTHKALISGNAGPSLELAISIWLDVKARKSNSPETASAYAETLNAFRTALQCIYERGYEYHKYHKTGVVLSGLVSDGIQQLDLFSSPSDPRRDALKHVMDAINGQWGNDTLRVARTGTDRIWRMKQVAYSPRYTTRRSELAKAR